MGLTSFLKNIFGFEEPVSELEQVVLWVSSQGGITRILYKMEESGFCQIVESWQNKKEKLNVDGDLVLSFINSEALRPLADKCGTDIFGAANLVAKFLPIFTEAMHLEKVDDRETLNN